MSEKDGISQEHVGELSQDNDGLTMAGIEARGVKKLARAKHMEGAPQKEQEKAFKQDLFQRLKDHNRYKEIQVLNEANFLGDQVDRQGNLIDPTGQGQPLDGKDAFGNLLQHGLNNQYSDASKAYVPYVWGPLKHGPKDHGPTDKYLAGVLQGNDKDGNPIEGQPALLTDTSTMPVTSVARDGACPNPDTDNYAVGGSKERPRLIKVRYPDKSVHYMPTDDTNPGSYFFNGDRSNMGEVSAHAMYGYKAGTKIHMQSVGNLSRGDGGPGHLSNDQWDEIGANGYHNADGTIPNNQKQYERCREAYKQKHGHYPPQASTSTAEGGGPKLLYGWWNVVHGPDLKCIGYANPASQHEAGGSMKYGSNIAFVSPGCNPISREGDGTTDGYVAATGCAENFFVGGAPTDKGPGQPA